MRHALLAIALLATVTACAPVASTTSAAELRSGLQAAVAAPTRTPANVARDRYRNPAATLAFFGVEPDDTVV